MTDTVTKREVVEAFQRAVQYAVTVPSCPSESTPQERAYWYLLGWVGSLVGLDWGEMPRV